MTTVYRLYDDRDQLLYVGIADHWPSRMKQHSREKPWWSQVCATKLEHHSDRDAAARREVEVIRTEHPRHNVVHNGTTLPRKPPTLWKCDRCGGAADYLQCLWDDVAYPNWECVCKACDTHGDRVRYWIATSRLTTYQHTEDWLCHLNRKGWFNDIPWIHMVARAWVGKITPVVNTRKWSPL